MFHPLRNNLQAYNVSEGTFLMTHCAAVSQQQQAKHVVCPKGR